MAWRIRGTRVIFNHGHWEDQNRALETNSKLKNRVWVYKERKGQLNYGAIIGGWGST